MTHNWLLISNKSKENAIKYYEDAQLLMTNNSFGHSMSLSILGIEEIAKAFGCVFLNFFENNNLMSENEITKVFYDHKSKLWMSMFFERINPYKHLPILAAELKKRNIFSEDDLKEFITILKMDLESIYAKSPLIDIEKQKGLYVELDTHSPLDIQESEAVKYIDMLNNLIQIANKSNLNNIITRSSSL
jgi:AbiV family abortive infection protein